ncbi:transporter substrate-binding domain-containing protein (plasmid) [Rhizobium sp. 32-5/1]|uniref:transporter substrate-binding domain-containing protein n=1 Tax=Rhizobium sp. 32-5/1 TaxID=3019602 RepID=UPI00240D7B32|nr:transporter substrate-binding domain-containing protein [Rhizobium sp. 32-5/1]WEZ85361.1 transporter substrate-binding domain-containing protein [Rhizobium sp. 32-5/1]
MRKTTRVAALSTFMSLFCASIAVADQAIHDALPESIKSAGVIRIGGAFESFPQLVADSMDATKPTGIAAELTAMLAPVLGVKFEWVNTPWPGQIPGLQSGSLDALMGQISVTGERERKMFDFVPYFQASAGIVLDASNPRKIGEDVKTLCGLKIGAPSGSLYGQTLLGISEKYCSKEAAGPITLAEFLLPLPHRPQCYPGRLTVIWIPALHAGASQGAVAPGYPTSPFATNKRKSGIQVYMA